MEDIIRKMAEQKILDAIERGELDNLPGKGRPLDLDDMRGVPPALRMEYRVLKNAGLLPEELTVQKEITALEKLIEACRDNDKQTALRQQLRDRVVYYHILLEKRRKNS
ncbi:MAG: DUF1992 domain-containing protein [Negativicutes bacterium]|nr:DUF1992 domain-containing protein [Negativicutes bacterium]MDR3591879.1 DUF1992 domain-containing protein [Negativicutes bacterium]